MAVAAPDRVRFRVRVEGIVQGVGFRPFVYRLAHELDVAGFVRNDAHGVLIEAEGTPVAVRELVDRLACDAPPLAVVERVRTEIATPTGASAFRIIESAGGERPDAPVAPDTATCGDCLAELFDPADRRYRYPFINCTNCGPRFTIVRGVPYDRPLTTMAAFAMCPACRAEYEDPCDRRFHAQPNACPECGPHLSLHDRGGVLLSERDEALRTAAAALRHGAIVAVKGIGGFHLACLADRQPAVAALRARKHREDKPFALMVRDLDAARGLVGLSAREQRLLVGPERPIVIARRRPGAPVADALAPRCAELGVMLPYSPLHHLLLAEVGDALVMTSGNVSDEPIAYRDEDALERLGAIADRFLFHDRPIQTRTDDSVIRALGRRERPLFLRRSRGYVPGALALPLPAGRELLACGAELKNTFCLAKGKRAWISHHVGDLENYETLASFTEGVEHLKRLFDVNPGLVVHDLHPEYLSTKHALSIQDVETLGVQHHHAHLAACLAEHGLSGPAVGAIFDGTGYGTDGTIWGGELLVGDLNGFERAGHLLPVRMPGGAQAIRQPWRMACAWLGAALGEEAAPTPPAAIAETVSPTAWRAVSGLARGGVASPITTSMGRLFDAVAALCGLRLQINYEGQAAIELEAASDPFERAVYPLPLVRRDGAVVLDARETIRAVAADLDARPRVALVAARFHNTIAAATVAACIGIAVEHRLGTVVLAGGTFGNRLLLERVAADLRHAGLGVVIPERLPPGDGAISYGQAAIAAASRGS